MPPKDRKDPKKPKEPPRPSEGWPDDPPSHGDEGGGNSFGNPAPRSPGNIP